MRQAVGLHWIYTARKPRAMPWAGMNQAFGLKTGGSMKSLEQRSKKIWVMTSA
jgi:hypothetical protein